MDHGHLADILMRRLSPRYEPDRVRTYRLWTSSWAFGAREREFPPFEGTPREARIRACELGIENPGRWIGGAGEAGGDVPVDRFHVGPDAVASTRAVLEATGRSPVDASRVPAEERPARTGS